MIASLAIGRAAFLELRRQRLLIVPLLAVLLSLIILGASIVLDSGIDDVGARDAEFAAYSAGVGAGIGAAIYALIIGSGLIARELSAGTLLMLAARPVARWQVFVGRLLASAAFLVLALFVVNVVYGVVATALSGSIDPIEDAVASMAYSTPAVLLALCVGATFSVVARPTAAVGSALALSVFALVVSGYVWTWQESDHLRNYLVDDVRDELPADTTIIGHTAELVMRAMPYGVFMVQAMDGGDERERTYVIDDDGTIDVVNNYAPGVPMAIAETADTTEGAIDPKFRSTQPKSVDDIDPLRFQCGEPNCFFGVRVAWKQNPLPPYPRFDDGLSVLFAWLAIPLWALLGAGLLARRRDLV